MRRAASSIRVRIVVGYLVLMATALGVSTVIARHLQSVRIDREVESSLVHEVDELRLMASQGDYGIRGLFNAYLANHAAGDHEAFYTIPLDAIPSGAAVGDGIRYSFAAPSEIVEDAELIRTWASTDSETFATFDTAAGETRALIIPIRASRQSATTLDVPDPDTATVEPGRVLGVFVVAHFMDTHRRELDELVRLLVLAGLVVLVVTTGAVWAMAGRIIAPVRELTRAARAVTHSDLSARIPLSGGGELTELGSTFNDMVERLDRGFQAQRQFLDDIAHDLRTPLTIARGHLETLGEGAAERDEMLSIVLDELDRMGRSVSDLLILAKAEQPHFLRLHAVDYGDFANDLMQRASSLAPRDWVLDAAPRPGVLAGEADLDRLFEAMLNLVNNAVQHTAEGDEIGIGVESVGDRSVRLWVRDHGPGIGAEEADVLFQRFRRGRAAHPRRDAGHHDGMGLGLSIVDAIARAHGGTASHQASDGHGATFAIEIPVEPPIDDDEAVSV